MNQGILAPVAAPVDLNSVAKIAEALGRDPAFAATMAALLAAKASISGLASGDVPVAASGVVTAANDLGAGTIVQTITEKLSRTLDFADMAALDLSGGSDMSSAFDSIISKNDARVHLPPGTLRMDSSKIISARRAHWRGSGNNLTKITSATLRTLFTFSASPSPQDVLFEDI